MNFDRIEEQRELVTGLEYEDYLDRVRDEDEDPGAASLPSLSPQGKDPRLPSQDAREAA